MTFSCHFPAFIQGISVCLKAGIAHPTGFVVQQECGEKDGKMHLSFLRNDDSGEKHSWNLEF